MTTCSWFLVSTNQIANERSSLNGNKVSNEFPLLVLGVSSKAEGLRATWFERMGD
jgi:hypothetical protein